MPGGWTESAQAQWFVVENGATFWGSRSNAKHAATFRCSNFGTMLEKRHLGTIVEDYSDRRGLGTQSSGYFGDQPGDRQVGSWTLPLPFDNDLGL